MVILNNELMHERKAALTSGISLIIMTAAAIFSYGFVYESLMMEGDVKSTFNNILKNQILFKAGILGWLIILITDILVAWGFYVFMKPIDNNLSLLGAWLRLIYTTILAIAVFHLLIVLLLFNNADYLTIIGPALLHVNVHLFMSAFKSIWNFGLIIFGGHLLVVGYLALKSKLIPKAISILLLIASIGYIVMHLCIVFLSQYDTFIMILDFIFIVPMILGELGFGLWLLFKGGKNPNQAVTTYL